MTESIYDELVAPKLLELALLCDEHDMSLVASIEYKTGERAVMHGLTEPKSVAQYIAHVAALCKGNFDSMAIAITRKYDTSSSMYLSHFNIKENID